MVDIIVVISLIVVGGVFGLYAGRLTGIKLPCLVPTYQWSIGIYRGKSPLNLSCPSEITMPVLSCEDVADIPAKFVADPFMVYENDVWYMFFEVLNRNLNRGEIGLASSTDATSWKYQQIVLREPFHLAYPYVFKWNNEYFMIPDSSKNYSVRLYKATNFPYEWALDNVLLSGSYADSSIFYFNNKWWLFAFEISANAFDLHLFHAANVRGPWSRHSKSPVVKGDKRIARPGGRIIQLENNKIIRYAQDNLINYGKQINAIEIVKLTDDDYEEKRDYNESRVKG